MYWVTTGLAGLSVVLVIVNAGLFLTNQSAQAEVSQRQQYINQSLQLKALRDGIVRALASSAATNKDDQLRDLLAQFGFTVAPNPAAPSDGTKN